MIGSIIGIEENTVLINLSIDLNKIQSLPEFIYVKRKEQYII